MKGITIAALYGASAMIVLTLYSVWTWFDPITPLWIGLGAIFVPSLVVAIVLEPEARPPKIQPLVLAQAVLVAAIFGIAMPIAWTSPNLRLKALSNFPSKRAVERALDDRNPKVQRTACWILVSREFDFSLDDVYDALVDRPTLATQCLAEMPHEPEYRETTRRLAKVWHQTLMTGEDSCPYAEAVDSLFLTENERGTSLLACALHSTNQANRKCCADRLSVAYEGRKLFNVVNHGRELVKRRGSANILVGAAWDETSFVANSKGIPGKLGLNTKAFRAIATDIGCEDLTEGGTDDGYMRWLFDKHDECLGPEHRRLNVEVRAACVEFLANDERAEDVPAALCEADRTVRERRLAEAAKAKAGDSDALAELGENISRSSEEETTVGDFADMIANDREAISDLSREQLRNIQDQMRTGMRPEVKREEPQKNREQAKERMNELQKNKLTAGYFSDDPEVVKKTAEETLARERKAGIVRDEDGNRITEPEE